MGPSGDFRYFRREARRSFAGPFATVFTSRVGKAGVATAPAVPMLRPPPRVQARFP